MASRSSRCASPRLVARPGAVQVEWREGQARVTVDAVAMAALAASLERLQPDPGIRVIEATLAGRVEPGLLHTELVLGRLNRHA